MKRSEKKDRPSAAELLPWLNELPNDGMGTWLRQLAQTALEQDERWRSELERLHALRNPPPPTGFVYLAVTDGDRVKVGFARDPKARIAELQTGCPERLRLAIAEPGRLNDELAVHHLLEPFRIHGEWYERAAVPLFLWAMTQPTHELEHPEAFRRPVPSVMDGLP